MDDDIKEIKADISDINEKLADIKVDLKYHIRRTNLLEAMLDPVHKTWLFAKYSVYLLGVISTILGILALFKVI